MTIAKAHDYAIDAASLLETCLVRLRETIALDAKHATRKRHASLLDMETCLVTTERLLLAYICQQIDVEREAASDVVRMKEEDSHHEVPPTLLECIQIFQDVLEAKKQRQYLQSRHGHTRHGQNGVTPSGRQHTTSTNRNNNLSTAFVTSRSPVDSLLFRLIVALQLCLVRIDDAWFVITGRRHQHEDEKSASESSFIVRVGIMTSTVCLVGTGSVWFLRSSRSSSSEPLARGALVPLTGKVALAAFATRFLVKEWASLWMTATIIKSTTDVKEWQQQWLLVQTTGSRGAGSVVSLDAKSQKLIEYAMQQSPKSSLWHSEGEIRFLLLKRAMDLLYASVGTAVEATKTADTKKEGWTGWRLPMAAAAAASYYSFFDPSRRALEAISSSSLDLVQYAWGMVSLPAIKQLSLQASRLLKGAAIAERITIAGVPCFVLSRDPCPDLAAALMREKRRGRNRRPSSLTTIDESLESDEESSRRSYPKKDVILHFTGGGFFAHTLASDIPFLLDWSAKTHAIVICPEYSLLPEHTFPVALNQVTEVYGSLVKGASVDVLGIEADRVVVTGESTGGNLAAALCVKLCMEHLDGGGDNVAASSSSTQQPDEPLTDSEASNLVEEASYEIVETLCGIRLPDAIMLSCPALNLTLDLSPSRVVGQQDPVLPSGLISAISDAYAPPALGINKKDPLVSPFYAPDNVLRLFPPSILLFASSNDPLLDDSVDFNRRCCSLGVDSQLGAVSHMPHAYWGLGTAGFPEAQQVQHECQEWLVRQLKCCNHEENDL